MKTSESSELSTVVRRFIEEAGNLTQSFGGGRALGQIYAYLYFSSVPRNLGDMQKALGISKGSASMVVRQLEQWGAVRKVWVRGDRRDYYDAEDWLGRIVTNALRDLIGKRLSSYSRLLSEMESEMLALPLPDGEGAFLRNRMDRLRKFQSRAEKVWNHSLVRQLLK